MFDVQTVELIKSAPALEGLDTESLSEHLTRLFTELVALRIQLSGADHPPADTLREIENLRRLASTYELYAAALPEATDRSAAAFVGATAEQLIFRAETRGWLPPREVGRLHRGSISSDISSTLLFLIAGYPSDAIEAARTIPTQGDETLEGRLLAAIVRLARGDLPLLLSAPLPSPPLASEGAFDEAATRFLWWLTLGAIRNLAAELLGISVRVEQVGQDPIAALREVQRRSTASLPQRWREALTASENEYSVVSTYSGPYHLATLLISAGERLRHESVIRVPTPPGIEDDTWLDHVRRLAGRRPYLWSNHLSAIQQGYLEPGTSSAVSFPTGAGKSTLAELKIATALLRGESVVFLAPTLALVSQVADTLRVAFSNYSVSDVLSDEGLPAEWAQSQSPEIAVMTPERCLTLLGIERDAFSSVGLLVFDECHLLHPRGANDRRSLDAMLCVLGLLDASPECDLLMLSAMMSNGAEIAAWLSSVIGRRMLSLDLTWKPTRQARGCLVFPRDQVSSLERQLGAARSVRRQQSRRRRNPVLDLTATPHALFGLQQAWTTRESKNYSFLQLLNEPVALARSTDWQRLTPNKNEVAARLATAMARAEIKTLIFSQNRDHCASIASSVASNLQRDTPLEYTGLESAWRAAAAEDLGHERWVLGPVNGAAAPHHGLLLPTERRLNESVFARHDGINVIAATPTLAQGINLPAQAVIITGDGRFDTSAGRSEQLVAHELLNAAGRAGRAGHYASGVVLIIPSSVVTYSPESHEVGRGWFALQENIFSKSDQCLDIEDPIGALLELIAEGADDPLTNLLDRVQLASDMEARLIRYFLVRLAPESVEPGVAERLLTRSLAAYHARRTDQSHAFNDRIRRVLRFREEAMPTAELEPSIERIARITGIPATVIADLTSSLAERELSVTASTLDSIEWIFGWLQDRPHRLSDWATPPTISEALTAAEAAAYRENGLSAGMVQGMKVRLDAWIGGCTYEALEYMLGVVPARNRYCKRARQFVRGFARDVSYLCGTLAQVQELRHHLSGAGSEISVTIRTLASCIKEGFDRPEKLALKYISGDTVSRVSCHALYDRIAGKLGNGTPEESFGGLRQRVRAALDELTQ